MDDAISRAEALKIVDDMLMGERDHKTEAYRKIKNLPSIQPKQKRGRWWETRTVSGAEPRILWECDRCFNLERKCTNYCSNCGARMISGEEISWLR